MQYFKIPNSQNQILNTDSGDPCSLTKKYRFYFDYKSIEIDTKYQPFLIEIGNIILKIEQRDGFNFSDKYKTVNKVCLCFV